MVHVETGDAFGRLRGQIERVIVGQRKVIDQLLICLVCRGHAVLLGVPGLAKTLLISSLAESMALTFGRIQFTPDLMPSDITGTEVIDEDRATGKRNLRFVRGPVFANVILADEINRTPPKTQAALLEAMQEAHVTVGGAQHNLPNPFFVLATQNPIDQEGTYSLPEAQLDRFMFMIHVGYPDEEEEFEIVRRTTGGYKESVDKVLEQDDLQRIQGSVQEIPVAEHVMQYALRLVRSTRQPSQSQVDIRPDFARKYLTWGAGPRASQYLILAAKARTLLNGRSHVELDDIREVAYPVLRHRLITNFNAEADGVTSDDLINRLIQEVNEDGVVVPKIDAVIR